jgi:thioredoxin reductase (NADPH)
MSEKSKICDVLVIGAGPAGLATGIYSSWLGLATVILDASVPGSRALGAPRIENFPGFEDGIKGRELVERMKKQASKFGAEIKTNEEVVGLDLYGEIKKVATREGTYRARAVVIATGTQRRKLLVPGETGFIGRGVSYCTVCDGPLFRNAKVAVVGNSEEAVIDALFLADFASHVEIVTQKNELKLEGALNERLQEKTNVEIVDGKVVAILGDHTVKAIKIVESQTQRETEKEVKGIFISLGGVPMTEIVKNAGINADKNGCIIVDRAQRTNIEGVFAAGDCTCGGMQAVTAAGEGAMAAMKAAAYVRKENRKNP